MGQYYKAVNIDKHEYLEAYSFGGGAKLMESCHVGNDFVNALTALLAGPWHGDRVMYIGNYAWYHCIVRRRADSGSGLLRELNEGGEFACDPLTVARGRDDVADRCYVPNMFTRVFNGWNGGEPVCETITVPGHADTLDCEPMRYVVNETQGVYYDREKLEPQQDGCLAQDPLLIFLAVGNGLGDGDYLSNMNVGLVGSWACQTISASNERPVGLREIASPFDPNA